MPHDPARAAEGTSFDSQVLDIHKTVASMAASSHISAALPSEDIRTAVDMVIEWERGDVYVDANALGIRFAGNHDGIKEVIEFGDGFVAVATPIHPAHSSNGYYIRGPEGYFQIRQDWFRGYSIVSESTHLSNPRPIPLRLTLKPTDDGWDISSKGMRLRIHREDPYRTTIEGWFNREKFTNTMLSVVGACVAAIVHNPEYHF